MPHLNRIPIHLACLALLFGFASNAAGQTHPATRPAGDVAGAKPVEPVPFLLFDSRLDGPRLMRGWHRLRMIYKSAIWQNMRTGDPAFQQRPPFDELRARARRTANHTDSPIILDIEHLDPIEQADILTYILDTWRTTAPGQRLGFYGLLPQREYWTPVNYHLSRTRSADPEARPSQGYWRKKLTEFGPRMEAWRARNDEIARLLGSRLDCVCPSIYAFYDDVPNWIVYAESNLAEARRFGKPVYAVVSPLLRGDGDYVGDDYFRTMLDTAREHADGVIVWGRIPDSHPAIGVMVDFAAAIENEGRSDIPNLRLRPFAPAETRQ